MISLKLHWRYYVCSAEDKKLLEELYNFDGQHVLVQQSWAGYFELMLFPTKHFGEPCNCFNAMFHAAEGLHCHSFLKQVGIIR